MGLRFYGLMLIAAGLIGAAFAWRGGPTISTNFFAIEAGVVLTIGLSLLAAGGLRHGYHLHPIGTPPGDMDLAQATDPNPPK